MKQITKISFQYFLHSSSSSDLNCHCLLLFDIFCLRIEKINTRHCSDLYLRKEKQETHRGNFSFLAEESLFTISFQL